MKLVYELVHNLSSGSFVALSSCTFFFILPIRRRMVRKIISSLTNPSGISADRGRKLNSCPSYNPRSCRIESFL